MRKFRELINVYTSSNKDQDLQKHENRLLVFYSYPILMLAALANIIVVVFFDFKYFNIALINSFVLIGFAALLLLADKYLENERIKTYIFAVLDVAFHVFLIVRLYAYIGPAVWTISFIAILISMARNDKTIMKALSFTILTLGVYVWLADLSFDVGIIYRITQFLAFAVLFLVATSVQNISSERYHRIKDHLNQTELLSKISFDFIAISSDNFDEKINKMLEVSGTYSMADRSRLIVLSADQKKISCTHEWRDPAISTTAVDFTDIPFTHHTWWIEQIIHRRIGIIPNVSEMPDEAGTDKHVMIQLDIKSLISVPVIVRDKVHGFLVFESVRNFRKWSDEHQKMLCVLANSLGDAITRVESEKAINRMAYYDSLTSLPNRILFNTRLENAIHHAEESETQIMVMYIDLDSFKSVNDTMGHQGGDALLVQVAHKLSNCMRHHDTIARFGGDEFVVLIPDITPKDNIQKIADKIMDSLNEPVTVNGQEFFITASAGIAVYPIDGEEANSLIKNADLAMYSSKDRGKNLSTLCSPDMKEEVKRKVQLTNLLYRAQEKHELVLYYQPQVNVLNHEIIGLEALIRWQHPEHGMISPGVFIPLAEQTGLINSIGQWVLETACRQNKAWQDHGLKPLRMAVNLSVEQFRNPNLVSIVSRTLSETGLSPKFLELEITESIAIRETNHISNVLHQLKNLGVTISIDDFGTEYSSLARLKQLPIDRIKMAMQFVHGISKSDKDEAIAKVIINLAKNLGLKVIAEGVETNEQLDFLTGSTCDEVQGYYFYKPLTACEIEAIQKTASENEDNENQQQHVYVPMAQGIS